MKYIILYRIDRINSPTVKKTVDAESIEEVILKFKQKVGISSNIAIFNDNRKLVYENHVEINRKLKAKEQKAIDDEKTLPKRIKKVKDILKECGIRLNIKFCYEDNPLITFEYKGEKILDEDSCLINMDSTAFLNWCRKNSNL